MLAGTQQQTSGWSIHSAYPWLRAMQNSLDYCRHFKKNQNKNQSITSTLEVERALKDIKGIQSDHFNCTSVTWCITKMPFIARVAFWFCWNARHGECQIIFALGSLAISVANGNYTSDTVNDCVLIYRQINRDICLPLALSSQLFQSGRNFLQHFNMFLTAHLTHSLN